MSTARSVTARRHGTAQASGPADWAVLLAEVWPTVAARLERSLSKRRVDRPAREDIVQDVALRALTRRVPFGSAEDLTGWALTVGHNLWTDEGRRWVRRGARIPLGPDDERAGAVAVEGDADPAAVVEKRLVVDAVVDALRAMSAADRESILRMVEGRRSHDRAETNRWGQRRSRVRDRLRAVADGAAAAVAVVRVRLGKVEPRMGEPMVGLVAAASVPSSRACSCSRPALHPTWSAFTSPRHPKSRPPLPASQAAGRQTASRANRHR